MCIMVGVWFTYYPLRYVFLSVLLPLLLDMLECYHASFFSNFYLKRAIYSRQRWLRTTIGLIVAGHARVSR
ncbi:hypothetical protein HD806DRAFT_481996 [Xylariaceae sp. AK1471]|nr:hypothetical protein HD806DRAFT_481996 [Xylariaceae sp. AK1471]